MKKPIFVWMKEFHYYRTASEETLLEYSDSEYHEAIKAIMSIELDLKGKFYQWGFISDRVRYGNTDKFDFQREREIEIEIVLFKNLYYSSMIHTNKTFTLLTAKPEDIIKNIQLLIDSTS